jgi:hypothetical protein
MRATFKTPYTQYEQYQNEGCEVLGRVDPATYDADIVGPLWCVRFSGGEVIEAWPEELGIDHPDFGCGAVSVSVPWEPEDRIPLDRAMSLPVYVRAAAPRPDSA